MVASTVLSDRTAGHALRLTRKHTACVYGRALISLRNFTMATFNDGDAAKKAAPSITALTVFAGDIIDAIQVVVNGGTTELPKHGGNSGDPHSVTFKSGEYITGIDGTTGNYFGAKHLLTLKILTNKGTYGPFGSGKFATDAAPFRKGETKEIIAFSGSSLRHTDGSEFIVELDLITK
jgi:hypothetical protein